MNLTREEMQRWPQETLVAFEEACARSAVREVTPGEAAWVIKDARRWCVGYFYETAWIPLPPARPRFRLVVSPEQAKNPAVQEWLVSAHAIISERLETFGGAALSADGLLLHSGPRDDPFWFPMPAEKPPPKPDPSPKSKVPRFLRERNQRLDGRR